jgi:NAD-dependent dihydropyrimidine dehydrogenase PreA subunit
MGLGTYFRAIKDAVQTIGEGMAVTASHMVRKPVTLEYPDRLPGDVRVQDTLPFRYRGMLEVDLEICTACLACERACPIDCIVIDAEKDKGRRRPRHDPLRHRHGQVHVLRPLQRAVPDRCDPSHARVRGRRLLAREPRPSLRPRADDRVQAEEGRRDGSV